MIGASCDMYTNPFPSILIGCISGTMTCLCLHYFHKLFEKCKLFDTRGILYIHGFPGIIGGIISAISINTLNSDYYGIDKKIIK